MRITFLKTELLFYLSYRSFSTIAELARFAGTYRSNVSNALNQLVDQGYVKRNTEITITDEGADYLRQSFVHYQNLQDDLMERAQTIDLFFERIENTVTEYLE